MIAFENHSYASILGPGAPAGEFTKLAGECGVATNFTAYHLPHSLPTYITANVLPLPNLVGHLDRKFTWIAPDEQRDMEVGTPAQASAWLGNAFEGSSGIFTHKPYTQGHTAVFIWFETGANSDTVSTPLPFTAISPSTPHVHSALALDDSSALRVWEKMLGVPCLSSACTAAGMGAPFHL